MGDWLEVGTAGSRRRPALAAAALLAVLLTALVLFSAARASASGQAERPLVVRAASLTQDGQQLVWHVALQQSFSPAALGLGHRSLCLLIERPDGGSVAGQACVTGPARHSRMPRLQYMPITSKGPGAARVVAATITRAGSHDLLASFLPSAIGAAYRPLRWQVISTLGAIACAPSTPDQPRCFTLFPAKPALLALHIPKLIGCVPAGPSLVSAGSSHVREIALTFDDGPWYQPPPSAFLGVLERERVPATFFEIGNQIATYDPTGAYERRMLADGDMIGDHSWSHPDVAALPAAQQRQQLESTAAAIRNATGGFSPCLWRPPYGDISPSLVSLARSMGFLTIMWDVDPRDWATPGVGAIYGNVIANARSGAIVIQHFGGGPRYQTLAALPYEIEALRHRGYRFVTVAQMLGLRLIYK